MKTAILLLLLAAIVCAIPGAAAQEKTPIRVGIIGLDTSHVPATADAGSGQVTVPEPSPADR